MARSKTARALETSPAFADSPRQRHDRELWFERVAVIFTHGQGEQTPMRDVLELAQSVWTTDPRVQAGLEGDQTEVWSVPVYDSDVSEQRRLVTAALRGAGRGGRDLQVDFYQFYWADLMPGNRFVHLWAWLQRLMRRKGKDPDGKAFDETPEALKPIRAWLMGIAFAVAAFGLVYGTATFARLAVADIASWADLFAGLLALALVAQLVLLVRPSLRTWAMSTGLGLTVASLLLGLAADRLTGGHTAVVGDVWQAHAVTVHEWMTVSLVVVALILGIIGRRLYASFLVPVMADSARMFSPTPDNIPNRDRIRKRGMELLEAIHNSERRYDRVIMLAHSLGTAVAYNVLSQYWGNVHRLFDHRRIAVEREAVEDAAQALDDPVDEAGRRERLLAYRAAVRAYHEALTSKAAALPKDKVEWRTADFTSSGQLLRTIVQQGREILQQAGGKKTPDPEEYRPPWRVTDFITCGSPLTYASLLLADRDQEFCDRIRTRELPQSPPQRVGDGFTFKNTPHHAALFAATCWTNIFFETEGLVRGDIIGGRIAGDPPRGLGRGVLDVAVRRTKQMPSFAHNEYWRWPAGSDRIGEAPEHLQALRAALQFFGDHEQEDATLIRLAPPRKP